MHGAALWYKQLTAALIAVCLSAQLFCALPYPAYAQDENNSQSTTATEQSFIAQTSEKILQRAHEATAQHARKSRIRKALNYLGEVAQGVRTIGIENLCLNQYDWHAVETIDPTSANEDGSLSVWQDGWFISHDWSDYGGVIANLQPGDLVTVDGVSTLILGRETWPKDAWNWDVLDAVGWNKTIFQTCLGNDALWIAWGLTVRPTSEYLAERAAAAAA